MRRKVVRLIGFWVLTLAFFCAVQPQGADATFFGEAKTGLQNIQDGYGGSFFVPENYSTDRAWPLIVMLHDEAGNGESYLQEWVEEGKKRGVIMLSPTYPIPRDIPDDSDKRLLNLVRDLKSQYEIDSNKVLVTGAGFGGHYAFYLALHYPSHFTAAASIGNGINGPFEKVFKMALAEDHKPPLLLVTLATEPEASNVAESATVKKLEVKGYSIEILKIEGSSDLNVPEVKSETFDWFYRETGKNRVGRKGPRETVKQKLFNLVDRTFRIQ